MTSHSDSKPRGGEVPAQGGRYVTPATLTPRTREVLGFHLHRYLVAWLARASVDRLIVHVGFEQAQMESAAFVITPAGATPLVVGWSFDDLCEAWRSSQGRLHLEPPDGGGEAVRYDLVAVGESGQEPGAPLVLQGFVLGLGLESQPPEALQILAGQCLEALRASRRNTLRLYFDEQRDEPTKAFVYGLLEHLPGWSGADAAASLVLTSNLEAINLEDSPEAAFAVLAERVFAPEGSPRPARLVGMELAMGSASADMLRWALRRQRLVPDTRLHAFVREPQGGMNPQGEERRWRPLGDAADAEPLHGFHRCAHREREELYLLIPLVAREGGEAQLLGFVALAFGYHARLSPALVELLAEMAGNIADFLRVSPLYTLGTRKLWILEQVRARVERAVRDNGPPEQRVESLVQACAALVARYVPVAGFAVGYLDGQDRRRQQGRHLRYVHPVGWSHFERLSLAVDVAPEARVDSGVSSLAVRLGKPLVLAGGHGEGAALAFNNALYVHEAQGRLVDARSQEGASIEAEAGWVRLGDYYKPARASTYATLAYPVMFAGEPQGVITVELERHTPWVWWTGFGGQLFWQLLAAELAYGFYAIWEQERA